MLPGLDLPLSIIHYHIDPSITSPNFPGKIYLWSYALSNHIPASHFIKINLGYTLEMSTIRVYIYTAGENPVRPQLLRLLP